MFYGTVKTLEPLSIEIQQGVVLTKNQLFLGQMCRPHKVKIPHTHIYNGKTELSRATIDGDLKITTVGATTTVVEPTGHTHNIKEQVTEDVHLKGSDYEECVILEIEPKLAVGDTVLMFAFNDFQKFYVAERKEKND